MWTKLVDFRPKGHAYFRDSRGCIAVADASGSTPDKTDDGVLYVDRSVEPDIERTVRMAVPLKGGFRTTAENEEAEWLLENVFENWRPLGDKIYDAKADEDQIRNMW